MKTTKERDIAKAFVLTSNNLRGLGAILSSDEAQLSYKVHCIDGSSLQPESLDELLNLPNPRSRAIDRISISTGYKTRPAVTINFKVSNFGAADYTISGEDPEVVYISNIIDQHLEPMIQRYSLISVGSGRYIVSIFSWVVGLVLMIASAKIVRVHLGFGGSEHLWKGLYLIGFIAFMSSYFINRLINFLFPSLEFCIGDGSTRHENVVSYRKQLGLAAIIAIILGIVSSVIATYLTK